MAMTRWLILLATLAAGCFNVDESPCSFACGPAGACPENYQCLSDGYCHLHGDAVACGYSDLAVVDAAPPDLSGADLGLTDASQPDQASDDLGGTD